MADEVSDSRQRRAGLRQFLCQILPRAKTKAVKGNAQRCREYRQKLTEDPVRHADMSAKNIARCKAYRQKEKPAELVAAQREKARLRSKLYRERKKSSATPLATSTPKPKTRHAQEAQREKWRHEKKQQREKWSSQKVRRHRERSLSYYYRKKDERENDLPTKSPPRRRREERVLTDITNTPLMVMANIAEKLKSLKPQRSKRSIEKKKDLLHLVKNNCSPVKKNLYQRKKLNLNTTIAVQYLHDNATPVPCQSAGKKEKKILPKRLKWVHADFQKSHPNSNVSLRTLYRHLPSNIITSSSQSYRQCLCEICTNIDLKLSVVNKHVSCDFQGRDDLSDKSLCKDVKLECVERECSDCGVHVVREMIECDCLDFSLQVKWESWDLVENDKGKGKRRVLVHREGSLKELIDVLMEQLESLSRHLFIFRWQFMQFKMAKSHRDKNTAVGVFDFAENFLCRYQDEVQSAHWAYNQVTVHPCVLYYQCSCCTEDVIDYCIFFSDDLNHDAHMVKSIMDVVKTHLKQQVPTLQKFILFSDGCGAQYKSKLPFYLLVKDKDDIEVERAFFGSRHGKSSCDSSGGLVKKLVSDDVMAGHCIIQNAEQMFTHCQQNYILPPSSSFAVCSHTKRHFFLLKDVSRPLESSKLSTIPGTQKIHSLKVKDQRTLLKTNLSCFCAGCFHGNGPCQNSDFVFPFTEVHIPDIILSLPGHLKVIQDRETFFCELQKCFVSSNSFEQLTSYCDEAVELMSSFSLPTDVRYLEEEKCQIDSKALALMPKNVPSNCFPVITGADGNCLPRAVSFLLFGSENFHVEIRCRIVIALCLSADVMLDNSIWSLPSDPGNLMQFLVEVSECGPSLDKTQVFEQEVLDVAKDGSYMGLWQLFAISYFLQCKVLSLFPDRGWQCYQQYCNRLIVPPNCQPDAPTHCLMWSSLRTDEENKEHWTSNHFVPVLPLLRPKVIEAVSQTDLNEAFLMPPSSPTPSSPNLIETVSMPPPDFNDAFLMPPSRPKLNATYAVKWKNTVYVAEVVDMDEEEVKVKFMEEREGKFCWPATDDVSWEPFSCLISEVQLQLLESSSNQRKQWYTYRKCDDV